MQHPLPQGYIDALEIAHQASVSEPPRRRKPNTYRNLPAHTQEGFEDTETFDDLWNRYEFVEDLPVSWRHLEKRQIDHRKESMRQSAASGSPSAAKSPRQRPMVS